MKTNFLLRYAKLFVSFFIVFLWLTVSVNAQCPTVITSNPPPICEEGAGLTYGALTTLLVNNGSIVTNGATVRWYSDPTGGVPFVVSELVNQEGVLYIDNNDSGVDCGSRQPINIDFFVDPIPFILDKIFCSNQSRLIQDYIDEVLTPITPPGRTPEVYLDAALTTLANPSTEVNVTTILYVVIVDDLTGCKSQAKLGRANVQQTPNDPSPSAIQNFCSDSNPTVGDLNPGTTVTAIAWYTDIDSNGNGTNSIQSTALLVDDETYYIQINETCPSQAIPVLVNIDDPFNPGISGSLDYCENNLPSADFNLFDILGAPKDTNGTWSNNASLTTTNDHLGAVSIATLTTPGVYTFTYSVPVNGVCSGSSADVVITIYETFTSGTISASNSTTFCETNLATPLDLFTLLDGEDAGGQWTQGTTSTDPVVSSPIDLSVLTSGTYNFTYTQNVLPNVCSEESTTIQIEVIPQPETGTTTEAIYCENDLAASPSLDLFDQLIGEDSGGDWTDDNTTGALTGSIVDVTLLTTVGSYNFTYAITGANGCENSSTVIVTIAPAPESGTPNAPAEFCIADITSGQTYNLFDSLEGEDQTGTWTDDDASGALSGNTVLLDGLAEGTYNFTFDVDAVGTCDDVDVTVQIIILPAPETGTPTEAVFCENDLAASSPLDLFDQLTGEDSGGVWADDNATGALTGSIVDVTLLTTVGSYNFTYTITDIINGCESSSTVMVTINPAPESGTPNTPAEFCVADITSGQTYNLFDSLEGEDQTGTWNDNDTSGALSGNTVLLDGLAEGIYNFTFDVDAIGTCDDADVTVSIIINDVVAPTAASSQEFCDTATISDLIITGNAIQWYENATGGTPLIDTTVLVDGESYYATQVNATTGCESSIRTEVIATIYQTPNAGALASTPITACNNTTIDLNLGLDGTQDVGGIWYEGSDNTGTVVANPTTYDVTGFSANNYQFTYYIIASAPCVDDSITITITIEEPLTAGVSNGDLVFCSSDAIFDLNSNLTGADSGGEWTYNSAPVSNLFDPSTVQSGTYTYTITNSCGSSSASFDITVNQAPNAGTDNSVLICVADGVTDLFPLLGTSAQSGGVWLPALTSGTGEFDPSVDLAGTYIYSITAISPCTTDASASITVTVDDIAAPVVVNLNPEFCLADNPTVSNLNDAITITGTVNWYEDAALTILANETDSLVDGEDYYATQTNSSGCESSTNVQVTVTVNDTPTPILINSNQELCINDNPIISELTSNIDYDSSTYDVVWYDSDSGGSVVSESSLLSNGATYYAVLVDLVIGCESSVRLEVTTDLTSCVLTIPDGFSPNGDGVNDTFDMDNLAIIYPNFEIEIYNRNGNIVYKGNANTPRFDGKSNQSLTIGNGDLPVGVYFYIFNYNDGENKTVQGRLYLSR